MTTNYAARQASHLEAKVRGTNRVNALRQELFAKIEPALKLFIGKKICKVSGSLLDKVVQALPVLPCDIGKVQNGHRCFYTVEYGTLRAHVEVLESYDGGQMVCYIKSSLYLGEIENGILTKTFPAPTGRTDYTVDEVRALRKEIETAEAKLRELQFKLGDFGTHDNH